jgi:choline dehydrogenase-like flavoprotein
MAVTYDAVVVGSGLGASSFAYGLAQRGFQVAVVERGDYLKPESRDLSPLHSHYYEKDSFVGGLTKYFGAAFYRLREMDFQAVEMESGVSPAWPISYSDLEPYYGEAERLFKVHGSTENDASEPPRSTPWPHEPIPHQGPVRELVERVTARAQVPVSYIPRGIDYDPANGGKCVLCRHCDAYYCPRDAKMDAEIGALRPAVQTGHVTMITRAECLRVLTTPDGKKATGVLVHRDGEEQTINAAIVAVGAGLTGTPLLLWRSRGGSHPNGLANGSGALGRNWAGHNQAWVFPISIGVQKTPFHQKTFAINAFYASSPDWRYPTGVIQAAGHIEPIGMSRRYRYFASALLKNSFQTFVMTEALPSRDSGYALSDDGAKQIGKPIANKNSFTRLLRLARGIFRSAGYRVLVPRIMDGIFHSVGTARMGSDPAQSVVDADCRAHDVERLYLIDASVLPTAGAVNSGLTIAAVALRAAARVPLSV